MAASIWGDVLDSLTAPSTLGGLALLGGGGWQGFKAGVEAGNQITADNRRQKQQHALQGLLDDPNSEFSKLGTGERALLQSSPELSQEAFLNSLKRRFDPMAGLDRQYKQAQIKKLTADTANVGSTYGKAGTVVQGSDGRFYSIQFGSGGQRKILPLELGAAPGAPANGNGTSAPPVALAPQRGVEVVGDTIIDKATGAPVRSVAGNIAGGEQAKIVGRETGQGQMGLPKAATALKQYEEQSKVVTGAIDKAISQADGWTTGLTGSAMSAVPGTRAFDLKNTLNTIKANIGFDKLQDMRENSPTGGALGQVSEMENILLQSVWGSIEQAQSKEQLVENLNKIKAIRERFTDLKEQAYKQDVARFGRANVPNPETGQMPEQVGSPAPRVFNWTPDGGLKRAQ